MQHKYELNNDGTYISELGTDFGWCKKCGKKLVGHTYEFCDLECRGSYFREIMMDSNGMGD